MSSLSTSGGTPPGVTPPGVTPPGALAFLQATPQTDGADNELLSAPCLFQVLNVPQKSAVPPPLSPPDALHLSSSGRRAVLLIHHSLPDGLIWFLPHHCRYTRLLAREYAQAGQG